MATSLHNWSCRLSLFSSKAHLLHHHSSSSNWNHTLKNSRKQPLLARLTALVPSLSNMDKHKGQSDGGASSHHLLDVYWCWTHLKALTKRPFLAASWMLFRQETPSTWQLRGTQHHQMDAVATIQNVSPDHRWLPNSLFISTTESIGLLAFASSLPNSKPRSQAFIVNSPKNWVYLYSLVYHTV